MTERVSRYRMQMDFLPYNGKSPMESSQNAESIRRWIDHEE